MASNDFTRTFSSLLSLYTLSSSFISFSSSSLLPRMSKTTFLCFLRPSAVNPHAKNSSMVNGLYLNEDMMSDTFTFFMPFLLPKKYLDPFTLEAVSTVTVYVSPSAPTNSPTILPSPIGGLLSPDRRVLINPREVLLPVPLLPLIRISAPPSGNLISSWSIFLTFVTKNLLGLIV